MIKINKSIFFVVAIILSVFCSNLSCVSFGSGTCYLAPFEGKVIDTDTKEPIEGAAVLAVYYGSTMTVAGSNTYAAYAQETLTDVNGEFKIPAKSFQSEKVYGRPRGHLVIFKPKYGVFPNHKKSRGVDLDKGWWPTPKKYIVYELPKLKTREEIRSNLPSRPDIPYAKMKNFVRLINEERIGLGFSPLTIPKEGS